MRQLIFIALLISGASMAQPLEGYKIYTGTGKRSSAEKMFAAMRQSEVVLFGEFHNNPVTHWLQLEAAMYLSESRGKDLILSFEMFERDQQNLLNAYLSGKLSEKEFKDSCRLWPNYQTDYKPLIDFAIKNGHAAIAANVPRRYASLLFKKGRTALDTLSALEKSWMAASDFPLDSTLSQYAALLDAGAHMGGKGMMEAQAFKDATMAKFILADRLPNSVVLHFVGAYHSDYYQGIQWYLRQENAKMKIVTISTVSQSQVRKLDKESWNKADFIICVDEHMTSTH